MKTENSRGFVSLVGAGPGDPGLLTLRGRDLLEQADVVVYDALSDPRLLAHAPDAEHIYVGKRASAHSFTQEQINALLVEHGRAGKRVVRLKGGDPFVFGRGGEECEALHDAGIPFEVVPGVTAAIAAPAYAGIPVTHRDFNSSFTLITGHEKEEEYKDQEAKSRDAAKGSSDVDWSAIAKLPCLAFYMGVKSLPRITAKLLEHGMDSKTPAASIQWGTTPRQRTVVATVATLAAEVERAGIKPPALTIIGRVVSLRDTMNWFEHRPLFGQTVVVTRTRHQASDLTRQLDALGAAVIEAPTIDVVAPQDWTTVDAALGKLWKQSQGGDKNFEGVIFTSANGVVATRRRLDALNWQDGDSRLFGNTFVAVVGDSTAEACMRELAIRPNIVASEQTADGLATKLSNADMIRGNRFLMLRADIARTKLVADLQSLGATHVEDVAVYETHVATALPPHLVDAIEAKQVTWVTFTSSSTAKNFITLLGDDYKSKLANVKLASIGPVTSATLKELGLTPTVEARTYNIPGLVAAIAESQAGGV